MFSQQALVAFHELDRDIGMMQLVIGLGEPRDHVQPGGPILLEAGIGLFGRNLAAQLPFSGERHLLRDHDPRIAGGR